MIVLSSRVTCDGFVGTVVGFAGTDCAVVDWDNVPDVPAGRVLLSALTVIA